MGGKGNSECGVVIDLDNLVMHRYLSFAWFVRMAVAWVTGQDPFEGLADPIGEVINKAVREVEDLGLGGDLLGELQSSEPDNLSVNTHFMGWESKEFMRVFGGRGGNAKDYFCTRRYMIGLFGLGREVTKVYGNEYLLIEPHEYLRLLPLAEYREFYSTIRDFVGKYERKRANKEKNINETAFMTALAGLVINRLGRYGVSPHRVWGIIKEGGNSLVLYLVGKNILTPLDLTGLVAGILRLEQLFRTNLSRTLAGLAYDFIRGRGGVIDPMNLIGNAVFKYVTTGELGYIYNMVRTVVASEDYAKVRDSLLGGAGGDEGGD